MVIHEFRLPVLLASHLKTGGRNLSETELLCFQAMLTCIESPRPRFWGYEQITSQHSLWNSDAAAYYLGTESPGILPGHIDPKRVLIIGEADEDSPLALDYRVDEPRVVYLGGEGPRLVWVELASSYASLFEKLGGAY